MNQQVDISIDTSDRLGQYYDSAFNIAIDVITICFAYSRTEKKVHNALLTERTPAIIRYFLDIAKREAFEEAYPEHD